MKFNPHFKSFPEPDRTDDPNQLKAALLARGEELCRYLLPGGRRNGINYLAGSLQGGRGESLSVCLSGEKAGVWKDFATGEAGDNLLELLRQVRDYSFADACREAREWLGLPTTSLPVPAAAPVKPAPRPVAPFDWSACVAALTDAHRARLAEERGLSLTFVDWLHGAELIGLHRGRLAFAVHDDGPDAPVTRAHCRGITADEKGKHHWTFEPAGINRPVPALIIGDTATAEQVHVFESQWDALAVADRLALHRELASVALVATRGASNGRLAVAGLGIRPEAKVFAWEQNDAAGEKWLAVVAEAATAEGLTVRAVATPAPHKDANDWTRAGATAEDLLGAMEAARTVEASIVSVPEIGPELLVDKAAVSAVVAPGDFPADPSPDAFPGVVGEIVDALDPETEAHRAAVLLHLLAAVGSIVGRKVYTVAGGVRHHLNLFAVVVGDTSRARKGTAWAAVQPIIGGEHHPDGLDPAWREQRVKSGLSSGEGLKWFVRDPIVKPGEEEPTDPGETDKRLFVIEEEFAGVLQMGRREGNTLSSVLRQAWDGKRLDTLTKNDPVTATGAHVSIVGHITREELRSLLSRSDAFNGFANRFLWVASRRSKLLPAGGRLDRVVVGPMLDALKAARARAAGELRRTPEAEALWAEFYARTANAHVPGLLGAVTNRGEAQVLRLSALYAVLAGADHVGVEHLRAALALWEYCERSARWVFGAATGNRDADAILAALTAVGAAGLTTTEINAGVFQRNAPAARIRAALDLLSLAGLAVGRQESGGTGPTTQRWCATN